MLLIIALVLPLVMSAFCFLFKKAAGGIALANSFVLFIISIAVFAIGNQLAPALMLYASAFNSGIYMAAAFFTLIVALYSIRSTEGMERTGEYFGYLLITIGAAAGVLFASDFLTLLFFWGLLGVPLYLLIGIRNGGSAAANKALITVGGSDALMMIGIALIWAINGNLMIGSAKLMLNNVFTISAYLALMAGAFAKAGAMPLHSWIPDSSEVAPAEVMAFLPASLDKLLGIYLLARISIDVFTVIPNSGISILLMALGSVTILAAVMGALVQHDLKKLLSFHAVSQVGYMVLGIGTGLPIGVAGGLFHMFNHALYKSCLFLCGGSVEKSTGRTEISRLGGLATGMPLTFSAFLIAAFSISGIPPFNGFVSKWMIFQSLLELSRVSPLWIVWLTAAMVGSAFTLASFVKLIYSVFLGTPSEEMDKAKEVSWQMWLPTAVLAFFCVIFGLFAYALPLKHLIFSATGMILMPGWWEPGPATVLILLGLLAGALIYLAGRANNATAKPPFIGGELLEEGATRVTGTEFYNTIRELPVIGGLYAAAERRWFDLYELGAGFSNGISGLLSWLHNGLLHTYLAWMFLGGIIIIWVLVR